ncbi:GNAT family N-acetyltransferase [Chungangia koreensis]|uniref:GNAT family N-acetyltransferase n=1 Tax=Chungangia koreensis TaxID=752657 RepID=A0ABV8X7E6_9LACT
MKWITKSFDELTTIELYHILKVRTDIFVVEQKCAYPEIDGHDGVSLHLFSLQNGEIAAYARLVPAGEKYEQASIGRVLVIPAKRKSGLGRQLVSQAIDKIKEEWDVKEIKLQAQSHLESFYGSFGFQPVSEIYDDDGIPHVDMLLTVR